jgi:hypothetical protein
MIIGVHQPAKLELFKVPQAPDSLRLGLRPREGGQKQTGQDRDDRDDDQQLNEGESTSEAVLVSAGGQLVMKCGALTKRRYILLDRPECGFGFHLLFAFVLLEAVISAIFGRAQSVIAGLLNCVWQHIRRVRA